MDKDLLELLDEIARITFDIKAEYDRLPYLLTNKDYISNYENEIDKVIARLVELRIAEDKAYSLLENNFLFISQLVNYLERRRNDNMDETARLCFNRIKNNLHLLMFLEPIEEHDFTKAVFMQDQKFQFLTSNGIDPQDAIIFTRKFTFLFETSVAYHFQMTLEEQAKNANTKEKAELLKIKLDSAFMTGNELEENFFTTKFETVKSSLNDSVANSFGIDPKIKDGYLDILAFIIIQNKLILLSQLNPCSDTTKLIFEFKTYILYISKTNLNTLKNIILNMQFTSNIIQSLLIQAIDSAEKRKRLHNGELPSKSL